MDRREFIALVGVATVAWPSRGFAQTKDKVYRLGTLTPGMPLSANSPLAAILLAALAERGYRLGQNLAYDARGAAGQLARLPDLFQDFKASGVDAVVTVGYPTAAAAKQSGLATVIAYGAGDPLATGLVASLAHPGGNLTGISDDSTALSTKRLALLKQMSPKLQKVAMLWNRDDLGMSMRYDASAKAARALGVTVQPLGVREPNDFGGVFEAMDRDGGLMSYGPDLKESFQRTAALVDGIFKGTKPSDLPFEQPTRYLFVINLKIAKEIGLDIPPMLVALADEVIE